MFFITFLNLPQWYKCLIINAAKISFCRNRNKYMLQLADINKISCEIYFGSFENMTSHSILVSHQTQEKEKECMKYILQKLKIVKACYAWQPESSSSVKLDCKTDTN